jgi:hypothetical protein
MRSIIQWNGHIYFWGDNADVDSGVAFDVGWQFILATFDGSNVTIYKNTVQLIQAAPTNALQACSSCTFWVGYPVNSEFELYLSAVIRKIQVYSVPTSQTNEALLYNTSQTNAWVPVNYRMRHYILNRQDITQQSSMQQYVKSVLLKRMYPLSTLTVTADGSAGIIGGVNKWQPGYTATVYAPQDNINTRVFRMQEIHNVVARNVNGSGYNHIAELNMVPQYQPLDTLQWTYAAKGAAGINRGFEDRISYLEAFGQVKSTAS